MASTELGQIDNKNQDDDKKFPTGQMVTLGRLQYYLQICVR